MIWHHPVRIEFNHCDPAGIVFYPRYFEMTNSVAENFFREVAALPYEAMIAAGAGVPTARIETVFHAPSRLGEIIDWRLAITKLGRSSITFHIEAWCADSHRVSADLVLVYVNKGGHPQPWPQETRDRIAAFQEET